MKIMLHKSIVRICFALLLLIPFLEVKAQTPVPMASQPGNTYTENFADIANWSAGFTSGIGASRWASYPITTGGTANDGKRTTKSSATFSTTTTGGIQRGTQNLVFLSTGSGTTSEAVAVDFLLDFSGTNAGTLSFNWAAVDNGNGTRPTSLRVFWSVDNSTFTELTAAQIIDVQSVNSGSITNIALPSAFNNSATARLRFYNHAGTVTGAGNRDKISIDDLTVTATPLNTPLIIASGTLASLSTVYGTPSTSTQFSVSGSNLNAGITITPPVGFDVATASDFTSTIGTNASPLTIGGAGTVSSTDIYVRLSANAAAGNHNGTIALTSTDANTVTIATNTTNTVTAKGLTITGITANDKIFDNTTTATLSGTPTLVGVISGDEPNVSVDASAVVANFNDATVNNNKPVTVSGYTLTGSASGNYALSQPTGLTASILPSGLQDQTITFDPLTSVTYGTAPFALTAAASSNLPVSYVSSDVNVATISGSTITITGAGTVTITAKQSGDGSYNPANDVAQELVVNPKELTISGAAAQDKFYDGNTTATIIGSLSGVINSDVVTLNLSGNFDNANLGSNKPVTSTSTLSGADASNYTLTQPTGLTASIIAGPCGSIVSNGVISWNFATAAPSSNTTTGSTVSNLSQGHNNGTTTLITSTSVSNYPGASGTQNAGAAAFVGPLNVDTSTYFEFTLTPQTGYNVQLTGMSFGSRSTASGPQAYTLRSSLDNYTADVATGTFANNSTWVMHTPTVSATASTNNAPITFRLFGHDGSGSASIGTANWRIDDLSLNVAALAIAPLSSPSTATACSGEPFTYTPTTVYPATSITWTRAAVAGISNPAVTNPQTSDPNEVLINTTNAPIDVVYVFTVTTPTCYASQNVTVTVNNCAPAESVVNLKLFIEAYYIGGGTMKPVKNNQGVVASATDVEDLTVSLYDSVTNAFVVSTTATLQTNGNAVFTFPTAPSGTFYLSVQGSNILRTWAANPVTVGATPLSYDFTTAANMAFGDNMKDMGDGTFAFYSGDINQDGNIDTIDYPLWETDSNNFEAGVFATDLNGDGNVDTIDYPIWESNSNNFVGTIAPF